MKIAIFSLDISWRKYMAGYKNKKNTNKVEELIQNSGKKKKVSTSKEPKKDL